MATKIQLRRDVAADWTSANPTLAAGEFGYEQDTTKFKIGDGSTAWNSLAYKTGEGIKVVADDSATITVAEAGTLYIQGGTNVTTSTDSAGVLTINAADNSLSLIDEDDFSSNSATRPPSQQSVKAYVDAQDANIASDTLTLTNKTFDVEATGNSISNIDVADLKSGVLDTDISSVSGSDDTLASAKAIKTYADTKAALTGSTDNTVATVTGANALAGEANLTFDGSTLGVAGTQTITNTTTGDSLLVTTTEDSSTAAPVITLKRNSGSPADSDYLGQFKFKGENDADQEVVYAKITGKISDASDGTEDGLIEFALQKAGSNNIGARLTSTDFKTLNGTGITSNGNISSEGSITAATTIGNDAITIADNKISTSRSDDNLNLNANGSANIVAQTTFKFDTRYLENVNALTNSATITVDCALAPIHTVTIAQAGTQFNFKNLATGQSATVVVKQDGTGSRTATFTEEDSSAILFQGGPPTLTTDANAVDVITVFNTGSEVLGNCAKAYSAS